MRRFYDTLWFLMPFLVLYVKPTNAQGTQQVPQVGTQINGERVAGVGKTYGPIGDILDTLDHPLDVAVTAHRIYITQLAPTRDSMYYHEFRAFDTSSAPITGVQKKPRSDRRFIVLFNDGSYRVFQLNHFYELVQTDSGKVPIGYSTPLKIKGDAFYLLTDQFVFVSRDSGVTWMTDSTGLGNAFIWDFDLDSAQYVYSATTNGLYVQAPDSDVWHKVTSFTASGNIYRVFVDRLNRIWVGNNGAGVYVSTDGGNTWTDRTAGVVSTNITRFGDDTFNNVYAVGDRAYKSAGGTGPWATCDGGILNLAVNTPSYTSFGGDSILVAGTSFGLFTSSDQGATWKVTNQTVQAETFFGVEQTVGGRLHLSTSLGIFSSDPPHTTWRKVFPSTGYLSGIFLHRDRPGNLYAILPNPDYSSVAPGPIMKSTDVGNTWFADTAGASSTVSGVFLADENAVQHLGSSRWGGSFYAMVYVKNPGGRWMPDTMNFPVANYSSVSAMASDSHGGLYVSGDLSGQKVMRRPIGGGPWVKDTAGIPNSVNYFEHMTSDSAGNVYGSAGSLLFKRVSGVWTQINSIAGRSIFRLSVDAAGTIWLAIYDNSRFGEPTDDVVYTTDQGFTWHSTGLSSVGVTALKSFGLRTFATTSGSGAYELAVAGTSSVPRTSGIVERFALEQNYPNPFNPSTEIAYRITKSGLVTLRVYDLLGREVTTLVNEVKQPGEYRARWNASRFGSGAYFYRLSAGSSVLVRKMVLLK